MIPLLEKNFRNPPMTESALFGILAFCALVDFPSNFRMFGTSGVGAGTFAIAGLIWAVFLTRPVISNHLIKTVLFLLCFNIYSGSTMLWSHTGMDGIQQLTVTICFTGILLVCARETAGDESKGHLLLTGILAASVVSVLMYMYVIAGVIHSGIRLDQVEGLINPRPYALYALAVVAVALAKWRGSLKMMPMLWALIVTVTIGLSMSRTALVCCIVLFPASIALRLNVKSTIQSAVILAAGAASFVAALFLYPPLYKRFFAEDAAIKMGGGVALNTSGRTRIWQVLWETIGNDGMFGKGVGAAVITVRDKFHGMIAQPHNDYLRFYYDTGMVGLALWLLFAYAFTTRTVGNLWRSVRNQTSDYPLHVAALLSFFALSWSMLTDNSQVYSYVMMPLAVVFGCSLGAGERAVNSLRGFEVIFEEPQPLPRNIRIRTIAREEKLSPYNGK